MTDNVTAPSPRFFLVMDFEATCERDDRSWPNEIIEFPAQLLDARTLKVVAEFREFVRPTERPRLTAFCTELTGIGQEHVADADILEGVLGRFGEWLRSHVGLDAGGAAVLPVTCGDWDLRQMLPRETRRKRLRYPAALKGWCNIKVPFEEAVGHKGGGMAGMLRSLGLELVGRHHSGIDDTRNIARILIELVKRFHHKITWTAGELPELPAPAANQTLLGPGRVPGCAPELEKGAKSRIPGGPRELDGGARRAAKARAAAAEQAPAAAAEEPAAERGSAESASIDPVEREVRKLRKKLQQMEALEQRQQQGQPLCDEQLQKLARLSEVRQQLAELTAGVPDAWDD